MTTTTNLNATVLTDNYTGSYLDVNESPDSPDANWITVDNATLNGEVQLRFGTPADSQGHFLADHARQAFRLYLRRTNNGAGNPTVTIELDQGGTFIKELLSGHEISSTSGELLEVYWSNDDLGGVDPREIRIRILGISDGTDNIEIGAVQWEAKLSDHAFLPSGYQDLDNNLTGSASDVDEDPSSSDSNWITADNTSNPTSARFLFENSAPRNLIAFGSDETAVVRFRVRRTDNIGGNDPSFDLYLDENSTQIAILALGENVTNSASQVFEFWFDAANELSDDSGDLMQIRFDVTDGGVSGDTIEYGAIRVNAAMVAPSDSDTGTSTEVETLIKPESKIDSDTGTGAESESFAAKDVFGSDSGTSVETTNLRIPKSGSDTGTGAESAQVDITDPGRRTPSSTIESLNLVSGDHTDLDDLPTNPDGNWVTFDETSGTIGYIELGLTDNPNGRFWAPKAEQTVRVYARRKNNVGDAPQIDLVLINSSGTLNALTGFDNQTVTSTTGELIEFKFKLDDKQIDGSGFSRDLNDQQLRVIVRHNGDNTDTVDLGAVDWLSRVQDNIRYLPISYTDDNDNLTGSVSLVDDDPESPDGSWITADSDSTETDAVWSFGDFASLSRAFYVHPTSATEKMHLAQLYLRRTDNALAGDDTPEVTIAVRADGVNKEISNQRVISSTVGELEELEFSADDFTDLKPDLDLRTNVTSVGASGNTVEYGALTYRIMFADATSSDTGSGTDAGALTTQITDTDSGTSTETASAPTVTVDDAESGSTTETAVPDAIVAATETATSQDDQTLTALLPTQSDASSTFTDTASDPAVAITETDSGSVAESSTKINQDTDSGSAAEAEALIVAITSVDEGTGEDTDTLPTVQRADSDTGSGADAQQLQTEDNKLASDTGKGQEFETLIVNFTETDTNDGFIDEVIEFLRKAGSVVDTGTGLEAGQLRTDDVGVRNPLQVTNLSSVTSTVALEDASDTVSLTGSTTTAVIDDPTKNTVRIR